MTQGAKEWGQVVAVAALLCTMPVAWAQQTKEIGEDYAKHIKSAETIGSLGNDLFGDQTNLYTGSTEFVVTDVSLAGNSALSVSIGRRFAVQDRDGIVSDGAFADWELDIPYLYGVFPDKNPTSVVGWQVNTSQPNNRCSVNDKNFAVPPDAPASGAASGTYFFADEYWSGNSLHLPGGGDQEMMILYYANPNRPTDGATYYWVTAGQWFFSCLATTANGIAGEAFLARSPEGVTYRFDHLVRRRAPSLRKRLAGSGLMAADTLDEPVVQPRAPTDANLRREEIRILPTRVEDRFGNWVTYTYDPLVAGRLTRILSNDNRQLDLTYNASGKIVSVTDGTRTWTYTYATDSQTTTTALTAVTLPDGSSWTFDLTSLRDVNLQYALDSATCENPGPLPSSGAGPSTITHPSGAVGTFTFMYRRHGRSYVHKSCLYSGPGYEGPYAFAPQSFDVLALSSKQITGPGLTPATWSYAYSAPNASWAQDCPTATSCVRTKTLTVTGPADWARYTYGTRWADDEGKLLKVERGSSASSILQVEETTYQMSPAGMAYPALVGETPNMRSDGTGQRLTPQRKVVTTRQGTAFAWEVSQTCGSGTTLCFDTFARPTKVTKSSAPAP